MQRSSSPVKMLGVSTTHDPVGQLTCWEMSRSDSIELREFKNKAEPGYSLISSLVTIHEIQFSVLTRETGNNVRVLTQR